MLNDICLCHNVMCHVTGKQLEMLSHETVHRNRIKLVATKKALNSQKCLITLYIVGWVIIPVFGIQCGPESWELRILLNSNDRFFFSHIYFYCIAMFYLVSSPGSLGSYGELIVYLSSRRPSVVRRRPSSVNHFQRSSSLK